VGKVWRNNQSFIYVRFGGDDAIALILPKTLVETFHWNVSTIVWNDEKSFCEGQYPAFKNAIATLEIPDFFKKSGISRVYPPPRYKIRNGSHIYFRMPVR